MPKPDGLIRKAQVKDVEAIFRLLSEPAERGEILPRSRLDLYGYLRDFFVWAGPQGEIVGAAALHICWEDLAEVRSLVVAPDWRGKGLGRRLVEACLDDAVMLGLSQIFVLTYKPDFFKRLGFVEVEKSSLPHKVWADCVHCVKFPQCDETAMVLSLAEK